MFCRTSRISCLLPATCPIRIAFSLHFCYTSRNEANKISHADFTGCLDFQKHFVEVTRVQQPTNSSAQPELTDQVTFTIP